MRLFIAVAVLVAVTKASVITIPGQKTQDANLDELVARQAYIEEYIKASPRAVAEDAHLLVPEIVEKYGYPVEKHHLTTSDGYILEMLRVPYGLKNGPADNKPVVYLQHGLLCSSADWVIAGTEKGLAYLLADRGYDVWMANARGNRYSRNHTTLSVDKDKKKFWDFSWHEIGVIDVAAMIDYTLEVTGQKSLFYIGHSQGTTAFYVLMSERPEYNEKIRAQFSLAPVAYMKHLTSPLVRIIALADGGIDFLLGLIGMYEFVPTEGFLHNVVQFFCDEGIFQILCQNSLFMITGFNKEQMNSTLLPVFMGHTPAGSSTKQLLHYGQEINSGKFRQYDHGFFGNLKKYGSMSPPNYDLKKVTAPVYLLYSRNDWMSAEKDVLKLYNELGNVQGKFLIADDKWNHLDYIFGLDAVELVYNKIFSLMTRH